MSNLPPPAAEDIAEFQRLIELYRYDFDKLVFVIFPFGQKGTELEDYMPYDWQIEEWRAMSKHFKNPLTRYVTYRLIISSGNGAAKTAFGAMTNLMLMYTQRLRCRLTANTDPQMTSVVWPEYDIWYRRARFHEFFFEKFGKSIKAKNEELADTWRIDTITWSAEAPAAISGLHNKGYAVCYTFEEAPGIPGIIWKYAQGAFTETGTIKLMMAFGNSDDPESYFEQMMSSPLWRSRRIDTRTLKHIDPEQIRAWLIEAGGDVEADDFRVRVRGLPRKSSKDSIISLEDVQTAFARRHGFDVASVADFPGILGCDPAWTGGDETTIWYQRGHYRCLLEVYKLDKSQGENHKTTYDKLCYWERELQIDAVFVDQGEGTAVITYAQNDQKHWWYLINFANSPNDTDDKKESQYANIRAQMYYETAAYLKRAVLDVKKPEWQERVEKELCWTKGGRHKITQKKICEAKTEIKARVLKSPDIADGCVLCGAMVVQEKRDHGDSDRQYAGGGAIMMPDHPAPYGDIEADYQELYD